MRQALTSLSCPCTWYYTTLLYKTSHCPKTAGTAKLSRITDAALSPDASTMHIQTPLLWRLRWLVNQSLSDTWPEAPTGTTFAAIPPREHHRSLLLPDSSPRAGRAGGSSKPGQAFGKHEAYSSGPWAAHRHKNPGVWSQHSWPKQGCSSGTAIGKPMWKGCISLGFGHQSTYPLPRLLREELTRISFFHTNSRLLRL